VKTKQKGKRGEYKTQTYLEERGWYSTLAGGSIGIFDIWAIHPDKEHMLLIQVKHQKRNSKPAPKEMDIMTDFRVPHFARKQVWIWIDYKREPRIIHLDNTN
jgi:Holliday junction resolvase